MKAIKELSLILPAVLAAEFALQSAPMDAKTTPTASPNIILILTDDQRADTLGCYGNPVVRTPHIDRLAAAGTLFTQATATSAICTPSRASIFTGMYERRHGINFNSGTALAPVAWQQSYPMLLRKGGYFIGYIGKNHVPVGAMGYETGLIDASFDYWYAGHEHLLFYPKVRPDWALRVKGIDAHMFNNAKADTQVEILQEGVENFLNPNQDFYDSAARFLERRPTDRPFCLSISFNLPHDAGTSTMEDRESDAALYRTGYHDQRAQIRAGLPSTYTAKGDIASPKLPADVLHTQNRQRGYDYVDTPEALVERIIRRYQTITGVDQMIGNLLQRLSELDLADNTVIIFSSDHGLMRGEFGLGGKGLNYDPCLLVPLIVYDPRSPARGQRRAEAVQLIDIPATILDYADMEIPASMSGHSLRPLVEGRDIAWRDFAFAENLWSTRHGNPRIESVRGKGWKYIRYFENDDSLFKDMDERAQQRVTNRQAAAYQDWLDASIRGEQPVYEELFDLVNDPQEAVNLAADPRHADQLEKLRAECDRLVREARGEPAMRPFVLQLESERLEHYLRRVKHD